jgi:hypothetical protein
MGDLHNNRKQERSFLKKRTKKLLDVGVRFSGASKEPRHGA